MSRTLCCFLLLGFAATKAGEPASDERHHGPAIVSDGVSSEVRRGTSYPSQRSLAVTPEPVPKIATEYRLLPADHELTDENAAVILLRIPYEEHYYMNKIVPKFRDLLKLPFDDPSIPKTISFESFYQQMRRAAYCSRAEWEYPMNQVPLAAVLLPDANQGRTFPARGLELWVRTKIAAKDYDAARESILVGLATARHYARTPCLVTQMIGLAIANDMTDEIERLIMQPDAPNLYWALSALPRSFFDIQRSFQWESQMLTRSVRGFTRDLPSHGDAESWGKVAAELDESAAILFLKQGAKHDPKARAKAIRMAREEWPRLAGTQSLEVDRMSDDEVRIRVLLWYNRYWSARIETAVALPPPQAIRLLVDIQNELAEWTARYAGQMHLALVPVPVKMCAKLVSIDRRFAALATIESIRDYASLHAGKLPDCLEQLVDTPAPTDPISLQPFQYSADGDRFTLRAAELDDLRTIDIDINPVYEVTVRRRR